MGKNIAFVTEVLKGCVMNVLTKNGAVGGGVSRCLAEFY
jgi:hypothetical protein